ncbi:MAG: hypothetical protein Q7S77_01815 [Candidatus Staskawiczbacteria bacterium]|nr:hypothetical protein [Candidatus Staskawiczbacteria bacterium]
MTKEFSQLFEYIEKMRSRYLLVLSALNIYDCLVALLIHKKVGKKRALKNEKTIKNFGYFFMTTKESCRCFFLIELAKFFDKPSRHKTLTVYQVLDYAKKNINSLTKEHFQQYHQERKILRDISDGYKEFSLSDLTKISKKIDSKRGIIKKLKDYRDQYLAHDDLDKIKVDITKKDIRQILNLLKSFIELFYYKLDFASTRYNNFTETPYAETKLIVEHLQNYEKYRIKEIEGKYNIKLPIQK